MSTATPIAEVETTGRDNGWHRAICPTCGNTFVWSTAIRPEQQVRCDHEIKDDNKKKRCPQKMLRMEWEYLSLQQRKPLPN